MMIFIYLLLILNTVESFNGNCFTIDRFGKIKDICCNNHEEINGVCIECMDGFQSWDGFQCRPCHRGFYGRKCFRKCYCKMDEKCDHVQGCLKLLPTTEAVTEHDHVEVAGGLLLRDGECIKEVWRENKPYEYEIICCAFYEMINGTCIKRESSTVSNKTGTYRIIVGFIVVSVTLLAFLLVSLRICVPLTCMYLKYKVSCKKRDQSTDHTNTTHPNEPENNPPRGETHEYDEVDDRFLNRESSVNDEYDVRSSGSSTVGSGICGVDSDGYLNPYHALKSIEITIDQGPSSE